MANFKVTIEQSPRNPNVFFVRHRDGKTKLPSGRWKVFHDYTIEKTQTMIIDGEKKTGKWLANKLKEKVEERHLKNEMGIIECEESLLDLKKKFLEVKEKQKRSPRTIRHYEMSLRFFLDQNPVKIPKDITLPVLENWKEAMESGGLEQSTIALRLTGVSVFCKWLVRKKKLGASPFENVDDDDDETERLIPPSRPKEPKFWTSAEWLALDAVLAKISHPLRILCYLAHSAGLRICEGVGHREGGQGVQWEDITWLEDGQADLFLRPEVVKGGIKSRFVPLDEETINLLGSRRVGSLVTLDREEADRLFAKAMFLAGLKNDPKRKLVFHGLRHTFAMNYLQSNKGNMVALMDLLGHSDPKTMKIYARFEKRYYREGIQASYERRHREEAILRVAGQNNNITPQIVQQAATKINEEQHGINARSGN